MINQILSIFQEIPEGSQQMQLVNTLIQLTSKKSNVVQFVGEQDIRLLESKKINYISSGVKSSEFHLADGSVLTTSAVKSEFFNQFIEKGFLQMDRSIYVNISNVKWYDMSYYRVYFTDEHHISVAGSAVKRLKQILGTEKNLKNSPNYSKPSLGWL